jgi:Bacterial Ig-like domain (group 2)
MSSTKSKLRLVCAFSALATLALAVGCRGFFVKPTLTAVAVGPVSPTIYVGATDNTVQMFAVGTFNDGSNASTSVTWSITGTATNGQSDIATIDASGLVTAQNAGSGTVTATSNILPTIEGTQPIIVSVACTSAPVVTPTTGTLTEQNPSISFTATCNDGQDISAVATWFSSNTATATFSANILTAVEGQGNDASFYITATANGFTSNQIKVSTSGF